MLLCQLRFSAVARRRWPPSDHRAYLATMPLSLAQAHVLIAAAHDHAAANGWKITVAVVDED